MKRLLKNPLRPRKVGRPRQVGVCFDSSGVALAFRLKRRAAVTFRRSPVGADGEGFPARAAAYQEALAALVAEHDAAGAKCLVSLPVAGCRVQWETLAGAGLRDLRAAVRRPAFWQTRLGVDLESHCTWWWFTRAAAGGGVGALLCAAPREEFAAYADAVRAAGLVPLVVGVSCFDYFDGKLLPESSRVNLVLDCDDACVVSTGAFGLRAQGIRFGESDAAALQNEDDESRESVLNHLAVCVRRSVEDEHASARSRADVKIIAARGLHGNWLESLQARLPGFALESADGWNAAGVPPPDGGVEPWRLPRAAALLACGERRTKSRMHRGRVPAVNFAGLASRRLGAAAPGGRYSAPALFAAACLLSAGAGYAHWLLLEEHRRLQPEAEQYARLLALHDRARAELETLRSNLSNRVLFYSSVQHVSFERKLMPRLLALIENATDDGVWLNEVHFERLKALRIAGKSLDDERISEFIRRLRKAPEIADVTLESATLETSPGVNSGIDSGTNSGAQRSVETPRLKDFTVICRLRSFGGRP